MKRVVITGLGITSCLGITKEQVLESLQAGRQAFDLTKATRHMVSAVKSQSSVDINFADHIDRKTIRFMATPQLMHTLQCSKLLRMQD